MRLRVCARARARTCEFLRDFVILRAVFYPREPRERDARATNFMTLSARDTTSCGHRSRMGGRKTVLGHLESCDIVVTCAKFCTRGDGKRDIVFPFDTQRIYSLHNVSRVILLVTRLDDCSAAASAKRSNGLGAFFPTFLIYK